MKTISNLVILLLVTMVGLVLPARADDAGPPRQPNILLIVADDLGWADVGWHGSPFKTPEMDKLVREGIELDRHYVQPVCSPTRTALMSGRWTSRFGSHVLGPTNLRAFPAGTVTLATALKQAGYRTCMAGKWHLGSRADWGPNHYGFDESYGSLNGAVDPWTHQYRKGPWQHTWHRNGELLDEEGNATELVGKQVVEWIRQKQGPWFIYVPFHAVHIPVDAPEEYMELYRDQKFDDDPAHDDSRRRLAAFVTQLDTKIGHFVAALEETGQRDNTLIVFTSDNGGLPGGKNPYVGNVPDSPALSSNEPLRGHKGQLYEGGIRVSAFANWPKQLKPGKLSVPLHAADWMPTLTKLAGWQPSESVQFDGRDIWPVLSDKTQTLEPRTIYIPMKKGRVVLRDGWKMIAHISGPAAEPSEFEMYHVAVDPSETKDLAAQEPQRLAQLQAELKKLRQDDVNTLPADLRGITDF